MTQGFLYCARCKQRSAQDAEVCVHCGYRFRAATTTAAAETVKPAPKIYYPPVRNDILPGRPGCLSIYVVLMVLISSLAASLIFIPVGRQTVSERFTEMTATPTASTLTTSYLTTAFVCLLGSVGLWRMKVWGLLLHVGILVTIILVLTGAWLLQMAITPASQLVYGICALPLMVGFFVTSLYWLITNRQRFA